MSPASLLSYLINVVFSRFVADWQRIVSVSLSFWMQVAGLFVLVLPELYFRFTGNDYDPYFAWWLGVGFLVAGLIGRLFQQGISVWREWVRIIGVVLVVLALAFLLASKADAAPGNKSPASEQETLDAAVPYIMQKEGIKLTAYRDIVGVWTICGGITASAGVRIYPGMTMTMSRCAELMRIKVAEYRSGLHRYFSAETISLRLPPTRDTAYTSLAYNIGVGTAGKSTAVRRLNAGDIRGGCEAITWFSQVKTATGHRVVRGLFERRKDEKRLCLIGI